MTDSRSAAETLEQQRQHQRVLKALERAHYRAIQLAAMEARKETSHARR